MYDKFESHNLLIEVLKDSIFFNTSNHIFLNLKSESRESVCKTASENRLGKFIYFFYKNHIPEAWRDKFAVEFRASSALELKRLNDLRNTIKLLSGNQIFAAPLKGAYIAYFAYPNPALRYMSDCDLLVKKDEIDKAWNILLENGYKPTNEFNHPFHLPMLKSPGGNAIELHYHIAELKDRKSMEMFPESLLWADSYLHDFHGGTATFLSPEITLLHTIDHYLTDNLIGGFKGIVDAGFIISKLKPNPERLNAISERTGFKLNLNFFLNIFPDFFPQEFGDLVRNTNTELSENAKYLIFNSNKIQKFESHQLGFQESISGRSFKEKFKYIAQEIFKQPKFIALKYNCKNKFPDIIFGYIRYYYESMKKITDSFIVSGRDPLLKNVGNSIRLINNYISKDKNSA